MASSRTALIRRAQVARSPDAAEPGWRLTKIGDAQAWTLAGTLASLGINVAVSSLTARDQDRPSFRRSLQLPMHGEPDLRERLLAPVWIHSREAFTATSKATPAPTKQTRFEAALQRIAARWRGGSVGGRPTEP